MRLFAVALAASLVLSVTASADPGPASKTILGWIEDVALPELGIVLTAKLDTGAGTSSLDARDIRRFRRGGERLVQFTVIAPGEEPVRLERPLERLVRIKRHNGRYQTRPVVTMTVCIGAARRDIEVSLIDRSNFRYPMLIGRKALAAYALVDPTIRRTRLPSCAEREGRG